MTLTMLTALMDLDRGQITGPFSRNIAYYTDSLARLMKLPFPKIVYLDKRIEGFEGNEDTRIVRIDCETLKQFPHFKRVQAIRTDPRWYKQVGWLSQSPQCRLPGYIPLTMLKMIWLHELAQENPFQTGGAFWIDAGICNNAQFSHFGKEQFIRNTIKHQFSFLTRHCHDSKEVHGFERSAFDRYCGGQFVNDIVCGGLFGGSMSTLLEANERYLHIMKQTIEEGCMGTEENLLTILAHQLRAS